MASEAYQSWARAFHGHAFLRRTAERNASFLLPRLAPGQRLIDIGCGPGSITADLAERVAPGLVVGVDHDAEFVAEARRRHAASNLTFERADATALPICDDTVDVAFLHAVLQHLESPEAALREVRRVVRTGGIVAVADADLDGYLLHPRSEWLDAALELDRGTRRQPDVGRRLADLVLGAGFGDVEFTVRANVASGPAVADVAAAAARRLEAAPFGAHVEAQGWATAADLAKMADAWRAWAVAPGALFVTLWCQAIGS